MYYFGYNAAGLPVGTSRANGTSTQWGYDPVQRLNLVMHGLAGTAHDSSWSYTHNPASQISSSARTNDAYAWAGHYAVNRGYTSNGLNQITAAGGTSFSYDTNGNLVGDGTNTFTYDIENRLVGRSNGGVQLLYDPLGRLFQVSSSAGPTTQFLYDGHALVGEYVSGAITRRYVHGPGMDVPLLSYAGANLGTPSYLHADERGSIVAIGDPWGAGTVNSYDEYGIPASTNVGRFQYTGQIWLPEIGMYHYKARVYSPTLGRFLQTDPIGYAGGMNLYGYVGNDPVNATDPLGLQCDGCNITVTSNGQQDCDEGALWDNDPRSKCWGPGPSLYWDPNNDGGGGSGDTSEGQCVFPGSGIRVAWQGNQINISGKIQFFDAPGGWATLDRSDVMLPSSDLYLDMINSDWTLDVGPWSISTRLTLGPGGLSAFVGGGSGMASPGHRWMWLPATSPGAVDFFYNRRVIRGEFGHHLGLLHQDDEALNTG